MQTVGMPDAGEKRGELPIAVQGPTWLQIARGETGAQCAGKGVGSGERRVVESQDTPSVLEGRRVVAAFQERQSQRTVPVMGMDDPPSTASIERIVERRVTENRGPKQTISPLLSRVRMKVDPGPIEHGTADENCLESSRVSEPPKFERHFVRAEPKHSTSALHSGCVHPGPGAAGVLRHNHCDLVTRLLLCSSEAGNERGHVPGRSPR